LRRKENARGVRINVLGPVESQSYNTVMTRHTLLSDSGT
jgi:hypothetical protein